MTERNRDSLHPKTGETAVAYHCREFSEFYETNQRGEFGDDTSLWEDKDDYASCLFGTLEEARSDEPNPFTLVSYSAGVYCGEVYSNDADAYPVLPGLENLPVVPENLDLWLFHERFDSPDSHADGAGDCVSAFVEALRTDESEDTPLELTPATEEAFLSFMKVAAPTYTAVLAAWNNRLSEEEFWKFWAETQVTELENYF